MALEVDGTVLKRGVPGYDAARRSSLANGRKPPRYPDLVVQAASEPDVISAVRYANEHDLKIGIRSGGHSWAGSFLRDGGILLDLSRLRDVSIDPEARIASVQPGLAGVDLNRALRPHGLFFPTGHCRTVSLGGFLLQGGFGWHSRELGPACQSLIGIDVVTADGELRHADANENPELLWAARGSGPGFFGVVTRFQVAVHPRPASFMRSDYFFPYDVYDDVIRFVREVQPRLPRSMECLVFTRRDLPGVEGPGCLLTGPVIADSREQALADLKILEECPVIDKAAIREVNVETELEPLLWVAEELLYPVGAHYTADNMWTHASADELLPGMRAIAESMPPSPSHMMWIAWGPCPERPDMAFSVEDDVYLALYTITETGADDERNQAWVTEQMRRMEPYSTGIQLADENLGDRPFRFISEANMRRLADIRTKWDPDGRFHGYMGQPPPAGS